MTVEAERPILTMPKHIGGLPKLTELVIFPFLRRFHHAQGKEKQIETEDVISEKVEWKFSCTLWIEEEPRARLGEKREPCEEKAEYKEEE